MIKLFKYLSILFLLAGIVNIYRTDKGSFNLRSNEKTEAEDTHSINKNKPGSYTEPGGYYVIDSFYDGITVYKDVLKKNKFPEKLSSMSRLDIKVIENGLGYSELLYGQYTQKGGWVEMNKLYSYDDMFPKEQRGTYIVKSSEIDGIVIYKTKNKKKKFKSKIPAMTELSITRLTDQMAFVENYLTTSYDMISGWVEVDKIELFKK